MQVALNPCAYPLANRELTVKCLTIVNSMRQLKSIKVGVNETIKSIEKEVSNLVLISADSEPFEIVQILPELCEEKRVTYIFLPSKSALGRACGLSRSVLAVSIIKNDYSALNHVVESLKSLINQRLIF
mmetsp:Transcript_2376/g.4356  ORF Transcript_2376/g.4356 Transcript_2376/m.4356 type:complete len:129 (+) Transcript_2376:293-679(+)